MKLFKIVNRFFLATGTMFLLAGFTPLVLAAPNVIVGEDTIEVGGTALIPVTFQGDGVTVAFQFQIDYDETQFTASADCDYQTGSPIPPLGVLCNLAFDVGGGDLVIQYFSSVRPLGMGPGDFDLGNISFQHIGSSADTFPLVVQNYLGGAIDESEIPSTGDTDGQITVESAHGNRQKKTLICHVGNEEGVDAGKIDLIVVANANKHLNNSSHEWDGISDYEPIPMGASGDGTEDSDGNGIDDGCEPPSYCPCWEPVELLSVTAANIDQDNSCDGTDLWPYGAQLFAELGTVPPEDNRAFGSVYSPDTGTAICIAAPNVGLLFISVEEAQGCNAQIAQRCATIGYPIVTN